MSFKPSILGFILIILLFYFNRITESALPLLRLIMLQQQIAVIKLTVLWNKKFSIMLESVEASELPLWTQQHFDSINTWHVTYLSFMMAAFEVVVSSESFFLDTSTMSSPSEVIRPIRRVTLPFDSDSDHYHW